MGKKKAPPLTKRFTNGHKTQTFGEAVALQECYAEEEKARQNFYSRLHTMKKNRNVILGDVTSRVDAPMLMPKEHIPLAPGTEKFDVLGGGNTLSVRTYNNPNIPLRNERKRNQLVNGFQNRRSALEEELEQVKLMVRHKQLVMAMSYNGEIVEHKMNHSNPQYQEKVEIKNKSIAYIG